MSIDIFEIIRVQQVGVPVEYSLTQLGTKGGAGGSDSTFIGHITTNFTLASTPGPRHVFAHTDHADVFFRIHDLIVNNCQWLRCSSCLHGEVAGQLTVNLST